MKYSCLIITLLLSNFHGFSENSSSFKNISDGLGYTENKGQIIDQNGTPNTNVKYLGLFGDLHVQIRAAGWSYESFKSDDEKTNIYRIDFDFINANTNLTLTSEEPTLKSNNYYGLGSVPNGIVGVKTYRRIFYNNIWNDVDIEFIAEMGNPKYNIYIRDPKMIEHVKIKISGAERIIIENGELKLKTPFGEIKETIPISFILGKEGVNKEVDVRYVVKDDILSFHIETDSEWERLIIDPNPQLIWTKTHGGNNTNPTQPQELVVSKNGYSYLTGWTLETSGIATSGAHLSTIPANRHVGFIIKSDPSGKMMWGTYYGNATLRNSSDIYDITILGDTSLIVVGTTDMALGIGTSGTFQKTKNFGQDAFLVKFDTNGLRKWGTYFGGNKSDFGNGIAADDKGNIYIAGYTKSTDTITTIGAYKIAQTTNEDAFIAKFNSKGQRLWSTLFGGAEDDEGQDITIDAAGNVYLIGHTKSKSNIASSGSHQDTLKGTFNDGFIAKFSSQGKFKWGSYFGGSLDDKITGISSLGRNIYFVGNSQSRTGISTTNGFQSSKSSHFFQEGFVTKMDTTGKVKWSTYIRGSSIVNPNDIAIGDSGNLSIGGQVYGSLVWNKQTGNSTYGSGFLMKLDSNGTFKISILLNLRVATGVSGFISKNCYVSGYAYSSLTSKARIMKYSECPSLLTKLIPVSGIYCKGKTVIFKVDSGYTYKWTGPKGFKDSSNTIIFPKISVQNQGNYSVILNDSSGCKEEHRFNIRVDSIRWLIRDNYIRCRGANLSIYTPAFFLRSLKWVNPNGKIDTNNRFLVRNLQPKDTGIYKVYVVGRNGCKDTNEFHVDYKESDIKTDSFISFCYNPSIRYKFTSSPTGRRYAWYDKKGKQISTDSVFSKSITYSDTGRYMLVVTASNYCIDTLFTSLNIIPSPTAVLNVGPKPCPGGAIRFFGSGGGTYKWTGPSGFTSSLKNPTILNANRTLHNGLYNLLVTNSSGCKDEKKVSFSVRENPRMRIQNNSPICEGETLNMSVSGAGTGGSYLWADPFGQSISFQSWNLPNAKRNRAGRYTVVGTDQYGCKGNGGSNAVINFVDPVASSNSPVFEGDDLKLFGSGGGFYTWNGPAKGYFGANQIISNVSLFDSGSWKLIIDKNGCKGDTTIQVIVKRRIDRTSLLELKELKDFIVYPNPSLGTVFIEKGEALLQKTLIITVYSSEGQEVINEEFNFSKEGKISLEFDHPGVYLMRVRDIEANLLVSKRLIIQ